MLTPKFKIGQIVSYKLSTSTKRARKGGIITEMNQMNELKDENKFYYPNGICRGELTTIKELSKGKLVGYAYKTNSIQPKENRMDTAVIEEHNLELSTKQDVLNSYHPHF